jgi:hypothetical protein
VREDGDLGRVPEGFSYVIRDDGEIQISQNGRPPAVLRGGVAAPFLVDVQARNPQVLNGAPDEHYKRVNERMGKPST